MKTKTFSGCLMLLVATIAGCSDSGMDERQSASLSLLDAMRESVDLNGDLPDIAVNDVAPEIVGTDLNGVDFSLNGYRGKVVLLTFTGNW